MVVEAGAPTDKEKRQPEGGHGQGSDGTGGDLLPIKLVPKTDLSGLEPDWMLYVSNNVEPCSSWMLKNVETSIAIWSNGGG